MTAHGGATQAPPAACGYVLGAELRACGVDFSFTPVLDLDWGESSVIGDRVLPPRPARGGAAGQEPDAWTAAGGHGQLRQALPGARLRQGGFARRDPGGPAQPQGDPGRRRARPTDWLDTHADQRDAGARDLSEGRCAAGGFFEPMAERDPARRSWASTAPCSATTSAWQARA